jgi:hypothetical protein
MSEKNYNSGSGTELVLDCKMPLLLHMTAHSILRPPLGVTDLALWVENFTGMH